MRTLSPSKEKDMVALFARAARAADAKMTRDAVDRVDWAKY
jgi:hypothetical protein